MRAAPIVFTSRDAPQISRANGGTSPPRPPPRSPHLVGEGKQKLDGPNGGLLRLAGAPDLIRAIGDGHWLPSITTPPMGSWEGFQRAAGKGGGIRGALVRGVAHFEGWRVEFDALP